MPSFLLIGAAKSGTTSLYKYLGQHPDIYTSPVKEPNFFAFEGEEVNFKGPRDDDYTNSWTITSRAQYERLFEASTDAGARGEASPSYLYYPKASSRIQQSIPNVRLIALLRHPVERAYSNYLMMRMTGREKYTDFATALQRETHREEAGWSYFWRYKQLGFYYRQLSRYYERFDDSQIRVFLYDDFARHTERVMTEAFQFLGVDDQFTPDVSIRHNPSGTPRFKWLRSIMEPGSPLRTVARTLLPSKLGTKLGGFLHRWNIERPPIPTATRQKLQALYREDILRLQDLIERDLSPWLNE